MKERIQKTNSDIQKKIREAIVSDVQRRRLLFTFLNAALSLIALIMTIINCFTGEYLLLAATLTFSILCLLNVMLIRNRKRPEKHLYVVFGIEAMMLLAFFIISGIPDGFSILWICLIPSFALLIFGIKEGSIFSLIALAMTIFLFWTPVGKTMLLFAYTPTFMLRFPFLYTSFYVISLLIEYVRRETQRQLQDTRQEYHYLYRHDALTGLYNRYGIKEFLDEAFCEKAGKHVAIIIIDADNFKTINDVYGHECGDEVLRMIASVPQQIMCEHCRCCRWGGEEFLMIMQCGHDPATIAEEIRQKIAAQIVEWHGNKISVTVSVGVCIVQDMRAWSVHDVIDQADRAMYMSKHKGKNQVTVLRPEQPPEDCEAADEGGAERTES